MAFTAAELVDLRRFAGFPALGTSGVPATVEAAAFEARLAGMTTPEEASVRLLLTRLLALEATYFSALETVDTKKAAVWERNPNALAEAENGLASARRRLGDFLGVALGPFATAGQPDIPAIFAV